MTKKRRVRPTERIVRYIIRQRQKGKSSLHIAAELGISPQYVRKLWTKFQDTGMIPVLHKAGRPRKTITPDMVSGA